MKKKRPFSGLDKEVLPELFFTGETILEGEGKGGGTLISKYSSIHIPQSAFRITISIVSILVLMEPTLQPRQ